MIGCPTTIRREPVIAHREPTLPTGLRIVRRGQSIETIRDGDSNQRLLVSEPGGVELREVRLRQGETLTLVPKEDVQEIYYLIKGALSCTDQTLRHLECAPGDLLLTRSLDAPLTLRAQTTVRLLLYTTAPVFWSVSQSLRELMELAVEVEKKDGYTAEHCRRLQGLAVATGEMLHLSRARLYLLDVAAFLHDVGKLRVPTSVLQKAGPLSSEEWRVVREHPAHGRELVEGTLIAEAGRFIEQHHERMDGSGYPRGLRGADIFTESYIIAAADVYDAMTTDRPYRAALPEEVAVAHLREGAGRQFPGEVVNALLAVIKNPKGLTATPPEKGTKNA